MLRMKISSRDKAFAAASSIFLGLGIILTATFVWPGFSKRPDFDTFFTIALIVILFPPAFVDLIDRRYRLAVNAKIPDFLRDITEGLKTGMTFTKAIEASATRSYGPFTNELRKTVSLLSWGYPYTEALEDMAKRVDTALMYRTTILLNEVGRSGGNLSQILESVYGHVKEMMDLERERRRQIVPYIAVIYASFLVYLFVVIILFKTFFAQYKEIIASGAPFGLGINPDDAFAWFFNMSVIESVVGGFVAGKMGEGAMAAGLKHALILIIISLLVFTLVLR